MVIFLKIKNQTEGEENREFPKAYQRGRAFYLCAIIKDWNYLYTIEIFKSSPVPLHKISFPYMPLSSILPVTTANGQPKRRFCP